MHCYLTTWLAAVFSFVVLEVVIAVKLFYDILVENGEGGGVILTCHFVILLTAPAPSSSL